MSAVVRTIPESSKSVLVRMAERFGVDPDKMLHTLRSTAFRGDVSNEQMMALMVVAEQYGLNPWTKEIYAFPDKFNGIVPVVGVDGWARIINSNPNFDGMDFAEGDLNADGIPTWIECSIHRKDRSHPTTTREYFAEVRRDATPWKTHPRRMLRHKAVIQCARLAFGFAGIYDPDEAEAIRTAIEEQPLRISVRADLNEADLSLRDKHVSAITDLINSSSDDVEVSRQLSAYTAEYLTQFPDLYLAVTDKLKRDGIIKSKAEFTRWLEVAKNVAASTIPQE